jgi:methylated-DNA-[protein]-cysteine S-methyltransferase
MKIAIINTPLGFTEICGDENDISKIHVLNEETEISTKIPKELKEAVIQLDDYFKGKRTDFSFKINPTGTDFQQKFGKNY